MEEIVFGRYLKEENGRNLLRLAKNKDSFEEEMICETKPEGLLLMERRDGDGYYYDITGRKALAVAFDRVPMNENQIRTIVGGILDVVDGAKEYLLAESGFLLNPEYIFLNFPNYEVGLCYYPENHTPFLEQLGRLFELFLNRVDYREEKAISFVYGLYMLLQEPDVTIAELKKRVEENNEKTVPVDSGLRSASPFNHIQRTENYGKSGRTETIGKPGKTETFGKSGKPETLGIFGKTETFGKSGKTEVLEKKGKPEKSGKKGGAADKSHKKGGFTRWGSLFRKESSTPQYSESFVRVAEEPPEFGSQHTRVLSVSGMKAVPTLVSEESGAVVELSKFPFFVGTLSDYSDFVIAKDTVSRFHAKFIKEREKICVMDLNSTNGTRVNGELLIGQETVALKSGDRVTFAQENYKYYEAN